MSVLICDICGGNLVMDVSGDFAVCENCGMKHTKERLKAKAQENKVDIKITNPIEIYMEDREKENNFLRAVQLVKVGRIHEALKLYDELTISYPNDKRAWEEQLSIIASYGLCVRHFEDSTNVDGFFSNVFKEFNRLKSVLTKEFNESDTVKKYESLFYEKLRNGSIIFSELNSIFKEQTLDYVFSKSEFPSTLVSEGIENANLLMNTRNKIRYYSYGGPLFPCVFYLGRNAFYYCDEGYGDRYFKYLAVNKCADKEEMLAECRQLTILDRKEQNLCQYCGGSFKGIFNKVCSKCGKPKDY